MLECQVVISAAPASLVAHRVELADIPRETWDRLLATSPAASPFARWTFQRAWWDAYGSTAQADYLVCLSPGADPTDNDAIRAIVPLMRRTDGPAQAATVFFAATYHADYATILAAPADLPAAVRAATAVLDEQTWEAVDLRRLRAADPVLRELESAFGDLAQEQGWTVVREHEDVCPVITAPSGDWDEYLAGLDKTARHEIRRKLRRAATVGDLSIEVGPPDSEAIDQFVALHGARFGEEGLFPGHR